MRKSNGVGLTSKGDDEMFFSKKLVVPQENATVTVNAVQTWEVRWQSRHGDFSSDVRMECEIFTDEATANHFTTALRNAFELVRHKGAEKIVLTMGKQL